MPDSLSRERGNSSVLTLQVPQNRSLRNIGANFLSQFLENGRGGTETESEDLSEVEIDERTFPEEGLGVATTDVGSSEVRGSLQHSQTQFA